DLPRGSKGSITYQDRVANSGMAGETFRNSALIVSAENDSNFADNTASVLTTIISGCVRPSITTQPAGASRCVGQSVTFSVRADGTTLSYQWRKDGTAINSATNFSYTIASIANSDAGTYEVVVSSPCGSATSNPVVLSLGTPVAVCHNLTVPLDASGHATITPAQIDNGSSDACGIGGLSLSQTNFDCANIGTNSVTLTVTDNNGNSATCTATVTVVDSVAPGAV